MEYSIGAGRANVGHVDVQYNPVCSLWGWRRRRLAGDLGSKPGQVISGHLRLTWLDIGTFCIWNDNITLKFYLELRFATYRYVPQKYVYGLEQDCSISSVFEIKILQSLTRSH